MVRTGLGSSQTPKVMIQQGLAITMTGDGFDAEKRVMTWGLFTDI